MSALENKPLLHDGRVAVNQLRRALAALVMSVGADARVPQEISRRFGIDKTLAWRIARAIREEDPWESLPHLPTRHGIGIFLGALQEHGAQQAHLDAVNEAMGMFEQFITVHSRDRETLEAMISFSAKKSSTKRVEAFRRMGFQSNSALLGVRALAQLATSLVAPSKAAGMLDLAMLTGLIQFCRLRPNLPWSLLTVNNWGGSLADVTEPSKGIDLLEGGPTPDGASVLMRDYCSQPLPQIDRIEYPTGTFRHMIAPGPVGNTGAATLWTGRLLKATAPFTESYPGERAEHGANLVTPCEMFVFDLLVHQDLPVQLQLQAAVYSMFPGGPQYPAPGSESTRMPMPTEVIDMGMGTPPAPIPEVERYEEMIEQTAKRMGFKPGDFHTFRYRLSYPPIPTIAILSYPLLSG